MKKRGQGKSNATFGRNDMFKHYSVRVNDMEDRFKVSSTKHSLILNKFNKEVSRMMLEEAFDFLLPHRIGTMRIKKYKPTLLKKDGNLNTRHLSVDWKKTNEMWESDSEAKKLKKVVYYENNHSEGYNYRWYFSNYRSLCKNKSAYCFKPTRTNKRQLASLVKNPDFKGDFYE